MPVKNLVDIILPVYNSEKFIIKTVNSIINQSFNDWRIIIIDDASSDKTLKILNNFYKYFISKRKIVILKNTINKGQAYSRNVGIKYAKSEFIAFIDSDDIWMAQKLSKQIKFMKNFNYCFTYTDYKVSKNNKTKIVYTPFNYNYSQFIFNTSIATSTMIIRRQAITSFFPIKIRLCEDYLFKCKLLKKYSANKCPGLFTKYIVRNDSLQSSRIKVLLAVWNINKNFNKMNIIKNLFSVLFISINSLIKYGFR
jgi:glycosyltransferase involved in cell wall biosynthesis